MKRTVFGLYLMISAASLTIAKTINVADHGIVPGPDVTFKVNRLLESLQGQEGVTLTFPKGRYTFKPENAVERYWAVTNHDNSLKRMAFPLFGVKGFTMADDGINVHGAYIKVVEYRGDKTFLCEISHRQQWGLCFAEPGDRVMVTLRETVLPIYETSVTIVKVLNECRMLVTVAEVPETLPRGLLSLENLTWYPDVIMRKNVIRDNRARSALITTKGRVLIEGNVFSSQMHGILIEGDNNSWYESGGVCDITITDNTFENIGYGDTTRYPLFAAPLLRPEQRLGERKYHRNIRFTNNRIRSFNGHFVHALSVQGLTVTGNTVELSRDYPTGSKRASIELDYCEDVAITNNRFVGFDWPLRVDKEDNCTRVTVKNNKGL